MKKLISPGPGSSGTLQRGSFLLEALVAVLIVALGVLGLIGLQARAMEDTAESEYRGEAAFLASDVVGQMWTANQATLAAQFATGGGTGTPYDDFKIVVDRRLPGASAIATNPQITITPRVAGSTLNGYEVLVTIAWKPPSSSFPHRYELAATVGLN